MFSERREIVFVFSAQDMNPNGDPLNMDYPRYDDVTGQILVSPERCKRTIRDYLQLKKEEIFVDTLPKTLKVRIGEIKKKFNLKEDLPAVKKCIDCRLFGAVIAYDNISLSMIGPVQFKWGRSLHKTRIETISGTAAFASKENKKNRSTRTGFITPFALIAVTAIANENASETTNATDDDLEKMKEALWAGTKNLLTSSKVGQRPSLLIEIIYKQNEMTYFGNLEKKIQIKTKELSPLKPEEELKIRNLDEIVLDLEAIQEKLKKRSEIIKTVNFYSDEDIRIINYEDIPNLKKMETEKWL